MAVVHSSWRVERRRPLVRWSVRCSRCEFTAGRRASDRGNFCPACGRSLRGQWILVVALAASIVLMIAGILVAFGHLPAW